jgi:Cu/Ag efflux pump CusA
MINRLIELSLRKRSIIVALYLGLAAWGWWALGATPIDAIPDLSDNQVIVFTDWIGHSPQEVEDQVTYPLTVNLQGLAGVRVVRSQSAFGFSMIYVIFEDNIDLYFARARVIERMSLISKTLPAGVTPTTRPASATPFGTRSRVVRRAGAPANLGQKTRSVSSGRHQPPILIAASDHPVTFSEKDLRQAADW